MSEIDYAELERMMAEEIARRVKRARELGAKVVAPTHDEILIEPPANPGPEWAAFAEELGRVWKVLS